MAGRIFYVTIVDRTVCSERLFANCVSLPYRPALFQKPRVQADENTHNVFFANVSIAHVTCALRLESLGICRGVD